MKKLWQKSNMRLHPLVEAYTVGNDYLLDRELMEFDIEATKAHGNMLTKIGVLTTKEYKELSRGLAQLAKEWKAGNVTIPVEAEDCHTVIEEYLTEHCGVLGKKIHTGRSRNDQVLVALRLYMKHHGRLVEKKAITLARVFLSFAQAYKNVPFPGYTHTQQAMLSSIGHYMASFVESLIDDASFLQTVRTHIDKNPLGSAAGFGVALPIDREMTTKELKFATTQINSLYCQNSRGKFESAFLESMVQFMMTLGKFAGDMLLFTSQEFRFFSVNDNLTTGSSIMPQKKNMDLLEIMRGNVSVVMANQHAVQSIAKNLLSGYNRDLQLIKKALMESVDIVEKSLEVAAVFLQGISPNKKEIAGKITKELFMADIANEMVAKEHIPFRDAYREAKKRLPSFTPDFQKNLKSKISLGAAGNLQLAEYAKRLKALS